MGQWITPLPATCCHKLPPHCKTIVLYRQRLYFAGKISRWMDNQEVCEQLRISPRTLQTLRDNGTLAYSQIGHKIFYKPEDVQSIVRFVEDRRKDAAWRGKTI